MDNQLSPELLAKLQSLISIERNIYEVQSIIDSFGNCEFYEMHELLAYSAQHNQNDIFKYILSKVTNLAEVLKDDFSNNFLAICTSCIGANPQNIEVFKMLHEMGVPLLENMDILIPEIAKHNETTIAIYLDTLGADFNAYRNKSDVPPITIAAYHHHAEMVLFLVEHGADIEKNKAFLRKFYINSAENLITEIDHLMNTAKSKKENMVLNDNIEADILKVNKSFKL